MNKKRNMNLRDNEASKAEWRKMGSPNTVFRKAFLKGTEPKLKRRVKEIEKVQLLDGNKS